MRFFYAAWLFFIIVGGLIIFLGHNPPPPQCIICGSLFTDIFGLVAVGVAIAGLAMTNRLAGGAKSVQAVR